MKYFTAEIFIKNSFFSFVLVKIRFNDIFKFVFNFWENSFDKLLGARFKLNLFFERVIECSDVNLIGESRIKITRKFSLSYSNIAVVAQLTTLANLLHGTRSSAKHVWKVQVYGWLLFDLFFNTEKINYFMKFGNLFI